MLWSALDAVGRQGIQFLVVMILARLIAPEEFGVIAIIALFVAVAGIFADGGFSSALIQRQNTTTIEESSIFYFNIGTGAVCAAALSAAAPWMARYFEQPIIRLLTPILAVNLFLSTFGSIHMTLLTKEINFKIIMKVGMVSSTVSGIVAVMLAWRGFGVWSLVYQTVIATVVTVLLLWVWHPWRPVLTFSFTSLRSYFRFGGYLLATGLADAIHTNLNSILIGKLYSAKDVGYFDRSQRTQLLPANLMTNIVNRVTYPVFSSVADDKNRLARGFRKAQMIVMLINIPVMIGIILLAKPLVYVLFGPNWGPSIPILQVLGLAGLFWPLHMMNLNVLMAQGRSDLYFRIMIIKKGIAIALTVVASFYGIMAIAWAQVISSAIAFVVNAHYTKVFLEYGATKQIIDVVKYFLASVPMVLAVWAVRTGANMSDVMTVVVGALAGSSIYFVTCRLMHDEGLADVIQIIRTRGRWGTPDNL